MYFTPCRVLYEFTILLWLYCYLPTDHNMLCECFVNVAVILHFGEFTIPALYLSIIDIFVRDMSEAVKMHIYMTV